MLRFFCIITTFTEKVFILHCMYSEIFFFFCLLVFKTWSRNVFENEKEIKLYWRGNNELCIKTTISILLTINCIAIWTQKDILIISVQINPPFFILSSTSENLVNEETFKSKSNGSCTWLCKSTFPLIQILSLKYLYICKRLMILNLKTGLQERTIWTFQWGEITKGRCN